MVDEKGQGSAWNDEELDAKSVVIPVVSRLEFVPHQPKDTEGRTEVKDLHDSVIEGDEMGKQIQVSSDEHEGEEDL